MSGLRTFATLSPTLLAGKGRARPAMRPPATVMLSDVEDDLGWNDMGEDFAPTETASADGCSEVPEVVRQREDLEIRFAPENQIGETRSVELPSARRAAFTLRLDADRHFRLRIASTVLNQSAQVVVTEALDRFLAQVPELSELAGAVRKRRRQN